MTLLVDPFTLSNSSFFGATPAKVKGGKHGYTQKTKKEFYQTVELRFYPLLQKEQG